jgi:hypothetical protein
MTEWATDACWSGVVDVTSPFHSLTRIVANKQRKLVLTPVNDSYLELSKGSG